MSLVAIWARYFALTLVVELGIAVPVLGRRQALGRRAAAVSFAQLISHPVVWFILPELGLGRMSYLLVAEAWALVIELLFYRFAFADLSWSRALAVSALANGASLAAGTVLG